MAKKLGNCLVLWLFCFHLSLAQKSNAWINYGKDYLKIEVIKDGIYKLTYDDLKKAGLVNFKNLQLTHHGKTVALETIAEVNGELQEQGSLFFYGKKNDGVLDSLVYSPASARTNPYRSLFSDISVYFLGAGEANTVSTRVKSGNLSSKATDLGSFNNQILYVPNEQYTQNNSIGLLPLLMQSYYEPGEGWSGRFKSADSTHSLRFKLPNRIGTELSYELMLNGRSQTTHSIIINKADTVDFEPFGSAKYIKKLQLPAGSDLTIELKPIKKGEYDWYSITYLKINYLSPSSVIKGSGVFNTNNAIEYDVSKNYYDISIDTVPTKLSANANAVYGYASDRNIFVQEGGFLTPDKVSLKKFSALPVNMEYLIISSPDLLSSISSYQNYRSSAAGGSFKTEIAYTQDIYDEYFYGEKNPRAILYYLKNSLLRSSGRRNLLLVGKAVTFPDVMKTAVETVPSFGYPGSDLLLSTENLLGVPNLPTGRLSVNTNQEVLNYLAKVKEFEALPPQPFSRKGLHITGGQSDFELVLLKDLMEKQEASFVSQGIKVSSFNKPTDNDVEQVDISAAVNNGVGFISYAGHGSTNELDYNFGYASDSKRNINNAGKYPIMFFNGCGVGNVYYRYSPLSTDWLLSPNKGAIAVLANSYWSYYYPTRLFLDKYYQTMFTDPANLGQSLGQIHMASLQKMDSLKYDPYILANMHQLSLQGDPAINPFPFQKPDYSISGIFMKAKDFGSNLALSKEKQVGIIVENHGRFTSPKVIKCTIDIDGKSVFAGSISPNKFPDTLLIDVDFTGSIQQLKVNIDTDNSVDEYLETNNDKTLDFKSNWKEISTKSLYPENILKDVVAPAISLRFDGRLLPNDTRVPFNTKIQIRLTDDREIGPSGSLEVYLRSCKTCAEEKITNFKVLSQSGNTLEIELQSLDLKPNVYFLRIIGRDASSNLSSPSLISFEVSETKGSSTFMINPNPIVDQSFAYININEPSNPLEASIKLVDAVGRTIFTMPINIFVGPNSLYLPIKEACKPGAYSAIFTYKGSKSLTQRLVVK